MPPLVLHSPPRPVLFAALAAVAGLMAGFAVPEGATAAGAGASVCLVYACWRMWVSRRIGGPLLGRGAALLAALALLGWFQAGRITRNDRAALDAVFPWADEAMAGVEGTLARDPQVAPDRAELILNDPRVVSMRVGGGSERLGLAVAVSAVDEAAAAINQAPAALPLPGQHVRAWGRLHPIRPPSSPGAFDPERVALGKGIGARLSVARAADLELGPPPSGLRPAFTSAMRGARRWIVATLESRLPAGQMPVARALLLGDAYLVSQDERDAYTLTGLAHLLAVSGMNTAFVLMILMGAMRLAGLGPRASAWGGIAGVLLYSALTGFEPPVARAAVMGVFILGGFLLRRTTTVLASLAAAALATLIADPRNLMRVDWQLSYGCVLSLVVMSGPLYDIFTRLFSKEPVAGEPPHRGRIRNALRKWLLLPFSVLIAVQFGVLPLQLGYFHQYNLLSPLYNLVMCSVSLVAMFGVIMTALLGWIPYLGALVGEPARAGLALLAWLVRSMAAVPHVSLTLAALPPVMVALYYALLLGGGWLRPTSSTSSTRHQTLRLAISLGGAIALVIWAQAFAVPTSGGVLDLYMLDVGQGDSLVTRFPDGKILVVDGGPAQGASDSGRNTIAPFLKTLGVQTIDCLAASHTDADHIGGIPYLLEHFDVRMMLEGPGEADTDLFRAMRRDETARGVKVVAAHQGAVLDGFAPARVRLLGPVPGERDNNASIIILEEFGTVKILMTGDLESAGEKTLLAEGLGEDIDILKLGHHGSKGASSEAMLEAFKPEAALISVGRKNRYGHPSPETLTRLAARGITAFRTDNLGTVWIRTDGKRIQIYHYAQ